MIDANRVKQIRELCGLTQSDFATKIGVTQSTVAYIESGRKAPSDEALFRISRNTGFPPSFFRQNPPPAFPLGTLRFRARASVTSRQQAQAHRYGQLVYEIADKLAHHFNSIPLRLPMVVDDSDPQLAAGLTRDALGLSPDTPIINLTNAIEMAGVSVLALPVIVRSVDAFSLWTGPNCGRPIINILEVDFGDRLRFSVAHELGHLVMHNTLRGDLAGIEKQADLFAGSLLLPEPAMREELIPPVTLTGLLEMKLRWGVSIQTLIMRANELEIITERRKTYLFQQLSMKGWRSREPDFVDVPVEKPRGLRQMAELLYGNPINYKKFADDLRLPEELLRNTIGAYAAKGEPPSLKTGHPDRKSQY